MSTPEMAVDEARIAGLLRLRYRLLFERDEGCPGLETSAIRLLTGQVPTDGHLQTCAACREAVERWPRLQRAESTTPVSWRYAFVLRWAGLAAAAGLLALVVWWATRPSGDPGSTNTWAPGDFQIKGGGDSIALAVQRGQDRFRALHGSDLQPGDELGFFASTEAAGYLALFNLDAQGNSDVLFPLQGTASAPVAKGKNLPLPYGGRMHPGEGCEWLLGVFSDRPLALDELRGSLRQAVLQVGPSPANDCRLPLVLAGARTVWLFLLRQS